MLLDRLEQIFMVDKKHLMYNDRHERKDNMYN